MAPLQKDTIPRRGLKQKLYADIKVSKDALKQMTCQICGLKLSRYCTGSYKSVRITIKVIIIQCLHNPKNVT